MADYALEHLISSKCKQLCQGWLRLPPTHKRAGYQTSLGRTTVQACTTLTSLTLGKVMIRIRHTTQSKLVGVEAQESQQTPLVPVLRAGDVSFARADNTQLADQSLLLTTWHHGKMGNLLTKCTSCLQMHLCLHQTHTSLEGLHGSAYIGSRL